MGAAFVASNVGPYKPLKPNTASLVKNNEDSWYKTLKALIDSEQKRQKLVTAAQAELAANWRLEANWTQYKLMFEEVYRDKNG